MTQCTKIVKNGKNIGKRCSFGAKFGTKCILHLREGLKDRRKKDDRRRR